MIMPLVVYGLCVASGLNPLYTIAAVVCAAVPTAKTVYILAGEYKVEEPLVAATVSITTLLSVVTLLGWLYALSGLSAQVATNRPGADSIRANPRGRQSGEPADLAVDTDAAARRRGDRTHQLNSCTEFVAVHEFWHNAARLPAPRLPPAPSQASS